jgi:hypothetical protein
MSRLTTSAVPGAIAGAQNALHSGWKEVLLLSTVAVVKM